MDLYIVRHAWAGNYGDPQWPKDDLRPLTEEGKERFALVVQQLVDRGVAPKVIATSPLVRCVETARILAAGVGKAEVVELDELRPGGDILALLRWTERQARHHEQLAWVGHMPDVSQLAAAMIGQGQGMVHFAKGAVAAVRFDGPPALGGGELRWLVTAKLLGC